MRLITIDPRALKPNPDPTRRTAAAPQADALLLATIKAVGIVQPPIISPQQDGGNGYYIQYGHRRVSQAIAAELAEIEVLVADPETDKDALRAIVENVAREGMNPVDLWRSIERLVGLGWTEEFDRHRARPVRASGPQAATPRERPAGDARPNGSRRYAERTAVARHRCRDRRGTGRGLEEA